MKKLVLKKGKERSVYNRHSWIFSGAVAELPSAENGEVIAVYEASGQLVGYGFYAPNSQIVCRVFEFCTTPLPIDEFYWFSKIEKAFLLRRQLIDLQTTNCYRLLHAEGDFFRVSSPMYTTKPLCYNFSYAVQKNS